MTTYNDNNYFMGQGVVQIAPRLYNGIQTGGFIDVLDADKLLISPKQTYDDIHESRTGLRIISGRPVTASTIGFEMNALILNNVNLANALWGETQGGVLAGTVAAEAQTAYNNTNFNLANIGVTSVVVKTAGTTTNVASIAVTAPGSGYLPNTAYPMTLSTTVGNTAVAYSNAAGQIVGVIVSGTGTTLATGAVITTPGSGSGTTFAINPGGTALTLNTDYTVNSVYGTISILPGSTIVPPFPNYTAEAPAGAGGIALTCAYSYAANNGTVEAFTTGVRYYSLRLNGINTVSGAPVVVNIYQVQLEMQKMYDLIVAKHTSMDTGGMILQDTTKPAASPTNPYSQFFQILKA